MPTLPTILMVINAQSGAWKLQANDNTRGGWLAVSIYVVLAFLCWRETARRYRHTNPNEGTLSPQFWLALSLAVTFLGVNKQLDLQTWLIQFGRGFASNEGITQYRRVIGGLFVALSAAAGSLLGYYLWRLYRRATNSERMLLFGSATMLAFVFLRTATMNHVELIGARLERHRPMLVLEILILIFLCFAARRNTRSS